MPYDNNAFQNFVHNLSLSEKIALYVTKYAGTMTFVYILIVVISFWIIYNIFFAYPFDSQDFFILFSAIAIVDFILMPFILVGQNLISKFNEKKEEIDHERNKNIELHLLKMEAMLNRLLPQSEKRTIEMSKNIQGIEETVGCITEQVCDEMEEEINDSDNKNDVFIRSCIGDMELDSLVIVFNPKQEEEIVNILNEIKALWDIVMLPTVLNIEGRKMVTFLCNPENEKEINRMLQNLLKENDFNVKLANN